MIFAILLEVDDARLIELIDRPEPIALREKLMTHVRIHISNMLEKQHPLWSISARAGHRSYGSDCLALLVVALWATVTLASPNRTFADVTAPGPRPNMILILADDLGWEDSEPYSSRGARSPNLARLAREGLRFDRAFLTCSSCSPSRSSVITSRYPHSTGAAELHQPLPEQQVTFVERLRTAGYWTAAVGKWHLGPHMKSRFDRVVEPNTPLPEGVSNDGSGCQHWLQVFADRPRDKPFFLWLAAFDPHRDYQPNAIAQPHALDEVTVPPIYPDTPAVRRDLALYYDEITRLDSYIGRLLEALDSEQLAEQTLVVFMTDNGRPFPRSKTTVYDTGIRTPLIMRWPARIRPGTSSGSLVSSVDLGPTLIELARAETSTTFQGKSFAPLLLDPSKKGREFIFAEHNWHDYRARERAVRDERFKYIRNELPELPGTPPADAVRGATFQEMRRLRDAGQLNEAQRQVFLQPRPAEELYDVQEDPHELHNLAQDPRHAGQLARMRAALKSWTDETNDRRPAELTPDRFDRETGKPLAKKPTPTP